VGVSDRDMLEAVKEIERIGGGRVVVADGKLLHSTALPIGGVMGIEDLDVKVSQIDGFNAACRSLGCQLANPSMSLAFTSIPDIPEMGITDFGLFDVMSGAFVNPFLAPV
jgi:adenine deaminase